MREALAWVAFVAGWIEIGTTTIDAAVVISGAVLPPAIHVAHEQHADIAAFFDRALRAIDGHERVDALDHPLFHVSAPKNRDMAFQLQGEKLIKRFSFWCEFGPTQPSSIRDRTCVQDLHSDWMHFLENRGFILQVVRDYSEPRWVKVVVAARNKNKSQFRFLFESEINPTRTMAYAKVSILRD
jgi:hypothetical protein